LAAAYDAVVSVENVPRALVCPLPLLEVGICLTLTVGLVQSSRLVELVESAIPGFSSLGERVEACGA